MELSNVEIWVIFGVLMLIAEIFAVSFFFMFIGVGALVTALLTWMGVTDSITSQLIVFTIVTAASMLVFRKQLKKMFDKRKEGYDEFSGERATVIQPIEPNNDGKVFYRGAEWIAYSDSPAEIPKNAHVRIKKADGIRLLVEAV